MQRSDTPSAEAFVDPVMVPQPQRPSGPDSKLQLQLRKILTCLYLSPFCLEFRRPVRLLHPSIMPSYCLVVKDPMDLGTVLLNVLKGAYADINRLSSCSNDLVKVFQNSIDYNGSALDMINISMHLLRYAGTMWEECVGGPFIELNVEPRHFHEKRLEERAARYLYVRTVPLYEEDKLDFLAVLDRGAASSDAPHRLLEALGCTTNLCLQQLQSKQNITLSELLSPVAQLITECAQPNPPEGGNIVRRLPASIEMEILRHLEVTGAQYSLENVLNGIDKEALFILIDLDNRLGEFTCHLAEKKTRGYALSAVWAHPHKFVWAQPNKSPWWPGMVLAGGDTPQYLSEINVGRLPAAIKRELDKIRPRSAAVIPSRATPPLVAQGGGAAMEIDEAVPQTVVDTNHDAMNDSTTAVGEAFVHNGSLVIPPNYCLVEFFGSSHDFGWVKTENIVPFPSDGSFCPPQREAVVRVDRCTNVRAITEAIEAKEALVAAVSAPRDDPSIMPTFEQLEADTAVPDVIPAPVKPARKRTPKKSSGDESKTDQEAKPKKCSKKPKTVESSTLSWEEPGMRFKSLSKKKPFEIDVRSQSKQRSLTDIHMVAMYLRSMEPIGPFSSKHSVPPPIADAVPIPPFVTFANKLAEPDQAQLAFETPRVFNYVDPTVVPFKSRKNAAILAMDAANITETIPELTEKKKIKKSGPTDPSDPLAITDSSKKKRRGGPSDQATPPLDSTDLNKVAITRPVNLRTGKRIQWRQAQLLHFAKLRADDEMDLPNLIAPTPDANGINQLTEGAMHRNWATTLSALSYQLGLSCSRLYFGEGVVHSEFVDVTSDVFHLESKSRDTRKAILRAEIDRLERETTKLRSC